VFTEADESQMAAARKNSVAEPETAAAEPAAPSGWFGRLATTVQNTVSKVTTKMAPDLEDPEMATHIQRFNQVGHVLKETRQAAEKLMFKQLEMAKAMEFFAQKVEMQADVEVAEVAGPLVKIALSEKDMAKEYEKHAGMMAQLLDEPLQDHIAMMGAATDLCHNRNTAAVQLTNARNNTDAKKHYLDEAKTKGADGKVVQLESELLQTQARQEVAQKKLDKFKEHLSKEVQYFDEHRVMDLKAILTTYSDAALMLANHVAKKRRALFADVQIPGHPDEPASPSAAPGDV